VTGKTAETLDSAATKTIDLTVSANGPIDVTATTSSAGITMSQSTKVVPFYGRVRLTVQAKPTSIDATARIDVLVSAEGVSVWHNITISIKADSVAPSVSKVTNSTGVELQPNATIRPEEVLNFAFSEPVTKASFDAANAEGKLKVVWGGKERDAVFTLANDGKLISVDLKGLAPIGTVTVTLDGLKDEAGNTVQARTLYFKVEAKEDEPSTDDLVLVIIIAVVILVIIAILFFLINSGSKRKEREDAPEEERTEEGEDEEGSEDDVSDESKGGEE